MRHQSERHLRHHRRSELEEVTRSQSRDSRNMDDDTVMVDNPFNDSSHEQSDAPTPPRQTTEPPSYIEDGGATVTSYGYSPSQSRSVSPAKRNTRQSTLNSTRSSSPEKITTRQSNLNPRYPPLVLESDELANSITVEESSSQFWHSKWEEERDAKQLCEGKLRSKNDELDELQHTSFSSDQFYKLQNDLAAEQELRRQVENDLHQKVLELKDIRRRWKQTALELDKSRTQSQGFYQVTDQYLIDLTKQLRYNMQSFAIQYFGGELRRRPKWEKTDLWERYMEAATNGSSTSESYLLSGGKCPSIIQAFLWRFIHGAIFDNFRWAGVTGKSFWKLARVLRPQWQMSVDHGSERNPEEEKKFQVWSATTTALFFDTTESTEGSEVWQSVRTDRDFFVERLCETLDPFLRAHDGGHVQQLCQILDDAIALDKEISRQVARVEWVFLDNEREPLYDAAKMQLEKGEKAPRVGQRVGLVVSPALRKRGKSTGEDFTAESVLVPLEVSCERVAGSKVRAASET